MRSAKSIWWAGLLSVLLLSGCGSASQSVIFKEPKRISFTSPTIKASIPVRYTCDGGNMTPPLTWGALPPGTGTVALFAVGFKRSSGGAYVGSIEWAVAGVNARLHKIVAGRLPHGAYLGVTSDGKRRYSICPPKGTNERYQFELYALPATASITADFAGEPVLESLESGTTATAHGVITTSYKRA